MNYLALCVLLRQRRRGLIRKCEDRKDKTLALNNLKQRRYIFQFSTEEELKVSNWTTAGTWARGGMNYWTDYQGYLGRGQSETVWTASSLHVITCLAEGAFQGCSGDDRMEDRDRLFLYRGQRQTAVGMTKNVRDSEEKMQRTKGEGKTWP